MEQGKGLIVGIDIENTTKRLVLSINGSSAKFTDRIVSGDIVVVKQEG